MKNRSHSVDRKNRSRSALRWVPIAKSSSTAVAFACAIALLGPPAASALERNETVRREFTLAPGGERKVSIDNVFGSVKVTGGSGDRVTVEIKQWAKSRRESSLAAAFEDVTLEERQDGGRLELAQDGPFRCESRGWHRRSGSCDWDPDYELSWEWTVTVPADVELEVETVNDGNVVVAGVRGAVDLSNVNGEIHARGLVGDAELSTVNGDVVAEFERVPERGGSFETVNGEIELSLPEGADAEVAFETMNGEIYSDFDVEAVPQRAVVDDEEGRRGGGRKSYRLDRDAVVRIGAGGPRFDCETLNGDIVVRSH